MAGAYEVGHGKLYVCIINFTGILEKFRFNLVSFRLG